MVKCNFSNYKKIVSKKKKIIELIQKKTNTSNKIDNNNRSSMLFVQSLSLCSFVCFFLGNQGVVSYKTHKVLQISPMDFGFIMTY